MKQGRESYFFLQEIAEFFYRLYYEQIISRKVSEEIIDILGAQQHPSIIPHHLDRTINIAHLVGEDEGTIRGAGIVFSKQPFILCGVVKKSAVCKPAKFLYGK